MKIIVTSSGANTVLGVKTLAGEDPEFWKGGGGGG